MVIDKKLLEQLRKKKEAEGAKYCGVAIKEVAKLGLIVVGTILAVMFFSGCSMARADAVARFMFWPQQECDAYIDGNPDGCLYVANGRLYNGDSTK